MFTLWNAKHIPLGPAPWIFGSACLLAKSDRIGGYRLDLLNRGHVIPLGLEVHHESGGFAPWNACPMKFPPLGGTPCEGFHRAGIFHWDLHRGI